MSLALPFLRLVLISLFFVGYVGLTASEFIAAIRAIGMTVANQIADYTFASLATVFFLFLVYSYLHILKIQIHTQIFK